MESHGGSEQGTTILEVLIALMVLGVITLAVFTAFGIGLRAATLAGSMQRATSLAEEALVAMTSSPCGSSFNLAALPHSERADLATYRREALVRQVPGADLWELSVTVSWTQEQLNRNVTLSTLRHISTACAAIGQ